MTKIKKIIFNTLKVIKDIQKNSKGSVLNRTYVLCKLFSGKIIKKTVHQINAHCKKIESPKMSKQYSIESSKDISKIPTEPEGIIGELLTRN